MHSSHKDKSLLRLRRMLNAVEELKQLPRNSAEFDKWQRDTKVTISNAFMDKPDYVKDFDDISYRPGIFMAGMPDSDYQQAYVNGLETAKSMLKSMIDEIEEYWEDDVQQAINSAGKVSGLETTNEVFIVHGRDDGAKEAVARFLTKLDLKPIVLHEQPNQGRTIIEKFEEYARVGFAVVLLTPDDIGALQDQSENLQPRARQNVILELGFFLGKLGRNKTCALRKENVEVPSDYDGVIYISMDSHGAWKMELVRELKGAGFNVDANRAL